MFTNPLNRKYQTGGSVDDEEFYSWLKTNVKEFKDYSIDQIKEGVRKMEQTEEGRKASASLKKSYEEYKKSKSKFADGGKFQDFICKHARGGNVDCGCGGMVIRGEDGIDGVPDGFLQSDTPVHAAALAAKKTVRLPWFGIGRRRVGATIDQNGGKHFYEWGDINGNTAQTAISIPAPGDTIVKQSVATNRGWIPNTYPQGSTQYETIMERFRPIVNIGVPYKEDGGIVMGKDGLSRKQIRQDKRKVLRAMNRPTAGAQYEDLVNQTRNWDRFAGMSRLERKNAINQLILNGEKPVVQTPIQPDLGENYVINETTVPYQFFNPIPQIVETPKVETVTTQTRSIPTATTQRSTSTNRRSNIARPEDFPMQEIVIPQISTNIPFGNGSRTAPSNNSTTVATPEQEPAPVFINGRFVNASLPEDAPVYSAPRDSEGNMIIKDEGNGVYWTRDAEGRLQKHEPVRTATIATSAPRRNYSAITGQPLRNGQSTWDLFKQGGKIEKPTINRFKNVLHK